MKKNYTLKNWDKVKSRIDKNKLIHSSAPYVEGQAMISFGGNVHGIQLKGIVPEYEKNVASLEDNIVEEICSAIEGTVVPANYNCPGQLVISGEMNAIDIAIEKLTAAGARRAIKLPVGGAFHSPLMESAKNELKNAIDHTLFSNPICPIYQNVSGEAVIDAEQIKANLIAQLTAPVKWTQSMKNILENKNIEVIEVGPGKVLQGLFKKVDRSIPTSSAILL